MSPKEKFPDNDHNHAEICQSLIDSFRSAKSYREEDSFFIVNYQKSASGQDMYFSPPKISQYERDQFIKEAFSESPLVSANNSYIETSPKTGLISDKELKLEDSIEESKFYTAVSQKNQVNNGLNDSGSDLKTMTEISDKKNTEKSPTKKISPKKIYIRIPSSFENETTDSNFKERFSFHDTFKTTGTVHNEENKEPSEDIGLNLTFKEAMNILRNFPDDSDTSQLWNYNGFIQKMFGCCFSRNNDLSDSDRSQCEIILKFSNVKFDMLDSFHKNLLLSYYTLTSGDTDGSIDPGLWKCIGFSAENPEKDLNRDSSALGILQLLYFSTYFKSNLSDMLVHSRMPPHDFTLIDISLEITKICISELKNKRLNSIIKISHKPIETIFLFYSGIMLS